MTNQTEFTPEIKAEAERLWLDAIAEIDPAGHPFSDKPNAALLALCRLLVATGFKPPVDPIEAKAREIVAESLEARSWSAVAKLVRSGDSYTLCHGSKNDIDIAKAGILAGMEMGK